MSYVEVMSEEDTLEALLDGEYRGCSRWGDGCFNLLRQQVDAYQKPSAGLAAAIAERMARPAAKILPCMIRKPDAGMGDLAYHRWEAFQEANAGFFPLLPRRTYGSSNISRMDSVPRLHTATWWHRVAQLWADREVALVYGSERSLTPEQLMASPNPPSGVIPIKAPVRNAWESRDDLFEMAKEHERVLLCAGPFARVIAHDLVDAGCLTYDLGHFGMWFEGGRPRPLHECPRC